MSRNLGPSCKQCRAEGQKLFLKGTRCLSKKCPFASEGSQVFVPGPTKRKRKKPTEYSVQLREKQKVKRIYGLLEKQFRLYYREASRKSGITGDNLIKLLESRLDNVIYRMNFASSRKAARQLIVHGHVTVNGKKCTIPSYLVRPNFEIEVVEGAKKLPLVLESLKTQKSGACAWVETDGDKVKGRFLNYPELQDMEIPMNLQLIVELYSK